MHVRASAFFLILTVVSTAQSQQFAPAADAPVAEHVKALGSKEMRNRADEILYNLGGKGAEAAPAVPAILERMKAEPYRDNQVKCAMALGEIGAAGAKESVPALLALVRGEGGKRDDEAAKAAAMALGMIGPAAKDAVPDLVEALDNEGQLGRGALVAVGRIGPAAKAAAPKLRAMLEDPEDKKRAAAAAAKPGAKPRPPQKPSDRFLVQRAAAEWALGAIGEPPPPGGKSWQDLALDDMGQCLTISDTYTGFFLRPVLVSIGAPAVPMLAEGLKSQKTWDRAAAVLAEMNNPIRSGSDSDFRRPHFAKPWKDEQRLRKVDAKTKAALVAAVPDLIALVGSNQASGAWAAEVLGAVVDDANRQAAIDALVERIRRGSGDPGALCGLIVIGAPAKEALAALAQDTQKQAAAKAAQQALLEIGGEGASGAAATALRSGSAQDRATAARALADGGPAGIPAMIAALDDFDPAQRRLKGEHEVASAVTTGLQRNRSAAIPKLIEATKGANRPAALGAAWMLGELAAEEGVPAIVALMGKAANENERTVCTNALGQVWGKSPGGAVAALKDPNVAVRRAAAGALRHTNQKDAEASLALVNALDDADEDVRKSAREGLFQQQAAGIAVLAKLTKDPNPKTRAKAARGLGAFEQPEARAAAFAAMKDADPAVRAAAIRGVFEGRGRGEWPPAELVAALSDKDATVRLAAAESLGDRPNPAALAALGKAVAGDRDPKVRAAAATSMTLQLPTTPPPPASFAAALGDPDPQVRSAVAGGLQRLQGAQVATLVPAVSAMLKHKDPLVRLAAARVLAKPEAKGAADALRAAMKDPDVAVRAAAAAALGKVVAPPEADASIDLAKAMLEDKEEVVRLAAATALNERTMNARGMLLATKGAPPLKNDPAGRARAVALPYGSGDFTSAWPVILAMAESNDPGLQWAAHRAMQVAWQRRPGPSALIEQAVRDDAGKLRWVVALARGWTFDRRGRSEPGPEELKWVELMRESMKSGDANTAAAATVLLHHARPGEIGDDKLLRLLDSDNALIRSHAAACFARMPSPQQPGPSAAATAKLLKLLDDGSIEVARAAAQALSSARAFGDGSRNMGTPEQEEMMLQQFARLADLDPKIRRDAIEKSISVGRPASMFVPQWLNALSDPDRSVRHAAALALQKFNAIRYPATQPR